MGVWWEMIGTNESTWWPSKYHGANTKKVFNYIDFMDGCISVVNTLRNTEN